MRAKRSAVLALILVIIAGTAIAVLRPHSRRLSAEVVVRTEDFGIPGVTKTYEAKLTNRGFLPARVIRCEFIDDTFSPGTMVAYAVQRWSEDRKQWATVVQFDKADFCKPYPLGIVKAKSVKKWLWPGQSLMTGEEATAARSKFAIGDTARFVIFFGEAGDYASSVASSDFRIDEHPQTDANVRIRH